MASRGCKHPADAFRYVCGQFIKTRAKKYSVEASAKMCEAYKAYFGMPVGDQDKPWAPHFTCEHCKKTLEGWYRGEKRAMKFAIPRIWREPTDHSSNCYFCMVDPSKRTEFSVGRNNVKWEPLVDPRKVLMPPLHIKLGLMKQFVRALDKESAAFKYLQDFFPKLSEAKVKAGVFVGPQIKTILECNEFPKKLTSKEKAAWNSFVAVVRGFLGNHKAENYVELVETLVKNYGTMGCRMSLKVHILDAHLDKFKENMGAYSEEQGERFHQDILDFERCYQGQYNENMMGDYIWGLIRESDLQYNRKSRKTTHF
ncbi:uncharacterized protein LOC117432411 isoform X3 [Acipenser ruthenus]|uniref:uncharacterized protein LOC117432411 isoform X3 n=1 Tax=Acipenser ruthenus TaxID=7906 RepID=UPI002741C3AD|nr:uncharacterized protein LOC117432411 isoform X3 [Acipenser ruthenus]